ncbi:hypothetical protein B0T21DRAFT_28925 [Apiosordaria backusii]|uniref:Uncharacterized protein n=1 Tax=Apiosordaria backusii TaxID=314023 RepID=A0AA40F0C5_9PEZI|nr:hypothetical protein B0T21DRAFT_28925 [Apiosordaria backusii]
MRLLRSRSLLPIHYVKDCCYATEQEHIWHLNKLCSRQSQDSFNKYRPNTNVSSKINPVRTKSEVSTSCYEAATDIDTYVYFPTSQNTRVLWYNRLQVVRASIVLRTPAFASLQKLSPPQTHTHTHTHIYTGCNIELNIVVPMSRGKVFCWRVEGRRVPRLSTRRQKAFLRLIGIKIYPFFPPSHPSYLRSPPFSQMYPIRPRNPSLGKMPLQISPSKKRKKKKKEKKRRIDQK